MLRLIMSVTAVLLPLAALSAAAAADSGPRIDRAWARATPGAAKTGAVYFRIESPIDDRLIGLASPVARKAELHTQVDEQGVMQMHEIEGGLAVPAEQQVELKAGGPLHVMLIDLIKPLKVGDRFPLSLTFEKAGARDVTVKVERLGAMGPTDDPLQAKQTTAGIGGPFTLVDQNGRTVSDAQFRGKWLLVYFGYTHCPDACPTALNNMAEALSALEPVRRDRVQPIFITVDPERDTPAVMKDYVGAFGDANIIGLSGTLEQVIGAEASYRIHAQRHNRKDGDYTMSHTSEIQIMDPDGRFVSMSAPDHIAERLAQLVP